MSNSRDRTDVRTEVNLGADEKEAVRREYAAPALIRLGDVAALTQFNLHSGGDGIGGGS